MNTNNSTGNNSDSESEDSETPDPNGNTTLSMVKDVSTSDIISLAINENLEEVSKKKTCSRIFINFIAFIPYVIQRCFCHWKPSSAQVLPSTYKNCKDSFEVYTRKHEIVETNPTQEDEVIDLTPDSTSTPKVHRQRPGTPRRPTRPATTDYTHKEEEPPPSFRAYFDVQIQNKKVDKIGDSPSPRSNQVFPIEVNLISGPGTMTHTAGGDTNSEIARMMIGPAPLSVKEVAQSLAQTSKINLLLFEFDLRQQFSQSFSRDDIFEILQMVFEHPNIRHLRVRIDNWRNTFFDKEITIPHRPLAHIRTDYPMKLESLVVYAPGITLSHILVWQGFLRSQHELETIILNFDAVEWIFYLPIVQNNRSTLRKLELYSVINQNGHMNDMIRFDFLALTDLEKLQAIKIWGNSHYYGLRHKNFESLNYHWLTEIEFKYVDMAIRDIDHLFKNMTSLRNIGLMFFVPVQIPVSAETSLPDIEFFHSLCRVLSEQRLSLLRLIDYRLPIENEFRLKQLCDKCSKWGYVTRWYHPPRQEKKVKELKKRTHAEEKHVQDEDPEYMEFERRAPPIYQSSQLCYV